MGVYKQSNGVSAMTDGGSVGTMTEGFMRRHDGNSISRVLGSMVSNGGIIMERENAMMGVL